MTVQDYMRVLSERWKLIAVAVLLGLLAATALFMVRPAEYTAGLSLFVSAQTGDSPQQAFQGAQLSEQRVKSYSELVTSERVTAETIRRLGLNQRPSQLAASIEATSAIDSVIINIAVTQRTPEEAAAIANTVGTVVTEVVGELERPTTPNGVAPVAVRIVQAAVPPLSPSSTGLPLTLAIGTLVGAVIGLGSAFVRHALDTSVKTVEVLSSVTNAPNLGVVAYDSKALVRPLTVQDGPHSPRSEAYRQLRTNLQYVDVDNPKKVILVTSSLPGEGKTTTSANLAIALASTNTRVLVIEGDLRRPRLSETLGLDRSSGLTNVLTGRLDFKRAIQTWNGGAFDVLGSGPTPPNPSELLSSQQMLQVLEEGRRTYDVVLIDSPPLLPVTDAAAIAPATDGALLVCRFKQTSRAQLQSAVATLRAVATKTLGTVFTMVPESGPLAYARYNSYYDTETATKTSSARAFDPKAPLPTASANPGRLNPDSGMEQATTKLSKRRPPR